MTRKQLTSPSNRLLLTLAGVGIICFLIGGFYFFWLRAGIRRSENILVQRSTLRPCVEMPTNLHEHRFLPNCKGLSRIGALEAEISFNSQAVRGPEYPPQPQAGVLRILVLGSSNVLGLGMPDLQTMPSLLQKNLSRELGRKVEVINGAVFGYSTWQSATSLRRLLRAYHPHLVIYHLSVPTYFLFDSIWENRLIKDSSGDPLAIDRSIFSDSGYFRSLNTILYRHVSIFLYLHTLHEQLRRLIFSWQLWGKSPIQQTEIFSAATVRALRYMNHITELEGLDNLLKRKNFLS